MCRGILPLALSTLLASGCVASTPHAESWTYLGRDPSLQGPAWSKEYREASAAEARENPGAPPSERIQRAMQAEMVAWQAARAATALRAKEDCVRETGDSGIPSFWTGYSARLVDCMKARGWWPGRVSDPL